MPQPTNLLLDCSMFFINSTKGLMYTLINHFYSFTVNCISATFCSSLMHAFNEDKYVFSCRNCIITARDRLRAV